MKLSAPPPPPPPPPEPPAPGEQPPPDPNANLASNQTSANQTSPGPTPETASSTVPSPETPPGAAPGSLPDTTTSSGPPAKQLQWPSWYPGVDSAIAGLVLLFAFASASFVARNSDVWLHLAAGKRLFAGQYIPGSDPFSYSGADRAWVNHSWLTDAIAYLFYGGEGKVLVIAKAVVVTLAFGVLLAIRRTQYALWPWAVVTAVAVLAAAPQFALRPQVLSMLFLAVTLYLLFRMPRGGNPWRFPIAIGITFWLWANCDEWFFLGPLVLLLVLVGDLIQTKLMNAPEDAASDDDEPLGRLPDTITLAKALGIGVLACMLTPHHVRIWELPFELIGMKGTEIDPRVKVLLVSPTSDTYYSNAGWGQNANGVAYAVLVAAGAVALGFGVGRLRVAHVALWVGFLLLSLASVYAIPFFAIVAVPLVSAQLNALSARTELKTWGDPKSRLVWLGSSIGRIACVLGVCALCVLTYPGWTQPESNNLAYARRVAWGVEADPLFVKASEQLKQWREQEKVPPEMHGIIAGPDLANYVAWFAPHEKVFVNGRYNHHRTELPDYVQLRKGLGLFVEKDERPNLKDATEVVKKVGAGYVAITAHPIEGFFNTRAVIASSVLYDSWGEWSPWYVDGRTTIFGWRPEGQKGSPEFAALRVDPVLMAFGPNTTRLPEPELKQPLAQLGWEEAFVRSPRLTPPGVTETFGWLQYKDGLKRRIQFRQGISNPLVEAAWLNTSSWHMFAMYMAREYGAFKFPPVDPDIGSDLAGMKACAILALRAARRAIAEDPDHPEPYFALAEALKDPDLPLSESERVLGQVTAYRQCLVRMPTPERYRRGQYNILATSVAFSLAKTYLGRSEVKQLPIRKTNGRPELLEVEIRFTGMPFDLPGLGDALGEMVVLQPDRAGQPTTARVPVARYNPNAQFAIINHPTFLPLDVARETLELALKYAEVDFVGEGSEDAKTIKAAVMKQIQGGLEAVKQELVRPTQRYNELKSRAPKLPALVDAAQTNSQLGEALRLLSDKDTDVEKEFGAGAPRAWLLRIALELALGRIENADDVLRAIGTSENSKAFEAARLTPMVQVLKYQKALQAGEYKTAGEILEDMNNRGGRELDKLPPPAQFTKTMILEIIALGYRTNEPEKVLTGLLRPPPLVPIPPLMQTALLLAQGPARSSAAGVANSRFQPTNLEAWTGDWLALTRLIRSQIVTQMESEASFFYRRGVLSLLEGDIPAAKRRFQQTVRKPPAGWDLSPVAVSEANSYLQAIQIAERKAVAP